MSKESLKEEARRHEQREEWSKALDLYLRAIEAEVEGDEPDIPLHNRVGDLQVRLGDIDGAVSSYERAIDLYLETGLPNNAIAICRKIVRNDPRRPIPFLRMGQIRARQGFVVDARQNFLTYAEMMQARGGTDDALGALLEFIALVPEEVETRVFLAEQLVVRDRPEEAAEQLAGAYRVLTDQDEHERAEELLARIREVAPGYRVPIEDAAVAGSPEGLGEFEDDTGADDVTPGDFEEAVVALDDAPYGSDEPSEASDDAFLESEDGVLLGFESTSLGSSEEQEGAEAEKWTDDELPLDDARPESVDVGPEDELEATAYGEEMGPEDEAVVLSFSDTGDSEPSGDVPMADVDVPAADLEGMDLTFRVTPEDEPEPDADAVGAEEEDIGADLPLIGHPVDEWLEGGEEDIGGDLPLIEFPEEEEAVEVEGEAVSAEEIRSVEADAVAWGGVGEVIEASMEEGSAIAEDVDASADEGVIAAEDVGASVEEEVAAAEDVGASMEEDMTAAEDLDPVVELRSRVDADPGDADGWHQLGGELLKAGDEAGGKEALDRAHAAYARAGEARRAIGVVRELLDLEPDHLDLRQRLVEYAYETNDEGVLVGAFVELGDALAAVGRQLKAEAVYRQVLSLDPDNPTARAALAGSRGGPSVASAEEDAPMTAGESAAEAQPTPPPPAPAGGRSGDEYVDLGALVLDEEEERTTRWKVPAGETTGDEVADFARMLAQFKEKVAQNLSTDDAKSYYDLGTAFKEMGLFDEAIEQFQQSLRADPGNLAAFEMLGQCFLDKGEPSAAIRTLERGLRLPTQVEDDLLGVYYFLGQANEAIGNATAAREFYEKIFSLDINFKDVTERLRILR